MKSIMTVTGSVAPDACKMVLSHEHLFIDLRHQAAPGTPDRALTPADHADLMCDPYALRDNLLLDDFAAALDECGELLGFGCDTVVDCSTGEIGRDPAALVRLARASGMKIVMGCGYYTDDTHTAQFNAAGEDELVAGLLDEITRGVDGVRPGIIGEIGTSREILPGEFKALRVAARCQRACGLSVQIHIYPWSTNGLTALETLTSLGVPPERIVICHSDVAPDREYIAALLRAGVYVQLDNFGKEFTPRGKGFAAGSFAKDAERVDLAAWIIDSGFGDQLLLTNDICLKCMLRSRGGAGYRHIFADIVPMLAAHGVPEDYIKNRILRENPLRMLTY